ncbi:HAD hydrolase family protein [Pendulispora brunnea]|uniref:HAD hydrolase family protein n=1 Tax=Pendulispora brunnea TaxID=2905690 RepID=A0ABZ2K7M9_9BACT
MIPLSSLDTATACSLRGLLFDLDDTFLSHGLLTRAAYEALWKLHDAGLRLVAVTGRPSGWGEIIVRQWPIDGAVTENGAVHLVREGRGIARLEACDEAERRRRRIRLAQLVERVRAEVPEARLADDVEARRSDVTWDIGERVHLPRERVDAIAAIIVDEGARTTRSSVHVHATFDTDDKASGTVRFLRERFSEDAGRSLVAYAFAGDSGNDAACFAAFRTTFGVANVRPYLERLTVPPRYVAQKAMGEGFAEIAEILLERRSKGDATRRLL